MPTLISVGLEIILGGLLIAAGIIQLVYSFKPNNTKDKLLAIVSGLLAVAVGVFMLALPFVGLALLTLMVAAFFLIEGILKIVAALKIKNEHHWGWMVVSGILSLLIAAIVIMGWPFTGVWFIGVLLGLNLIIVGFLDITISANLPSRHAYGR